MLFISLKYIGTMLSVFQRHNCICQVIIWTHEEPISYASESLIVIFLPWYNCCVYVLNGNKMFLIFFYKLNAIFLAYVLCADNIMYCDADHKVVCYNYWVLYGCIYVASFNMNGIMEFNSIWPSDTYVWQRTGSLLI